MPPPRCEDLTVGGRRREESCGAEALRRARGRGRTGRQHRRPGAGPGRRPGGAGRQGAVSRGTRPAATSSGRGACRCWPTSGCSEPAGLDVGDMVVVGPTGRRVRPPVLRRPDLSRAGPVRSPGPCSTPRCAPPRSTPGPYPFDGRADGPLWAGPDLDGFELRRAALLRADFVIGADGATSHVAAAAGLVDGDTGALGIRRARATCDQHVELPAITLWEQTAVARLPRLRLDLPRTRRRWPTSGSAIGTLADRRAGPAAVRVLPAYPRAPRATSASSTGCRRRSAAPPARGLAQDGNGRDRPGVRAGCCWWATPPDWSTPCRARASPRP